MKTIVENKVGATTVSKFTYRYDELGRRTDRVDQGSTFGTDELSTWGYDELGQVVEQNRYAGNNPDSPGAAITAENFEFSYDHIGNRLSSVKGTASARGYTSNALNQYTSITNPNSSPQYDDDGNMTFNGSEWYFSWDAENRLIFARTYELTASSGDKQISFAYDYQSRLVEKVVEEFDGTDWTATTHFRFVYDGWNLLAELEEDSSEWVTAQTYLWGLDLTQSFQGAGGVGGLLAITSFDGVSTESYYPSYDANGNVMEIYDELGGNAAIYRYGPFGELTSISETSGVRNPYKFSTKYFDEEFGAYYYGYRYYNVENGKWFSRDPIDEDGGINLYGFLGNNGIGKFDLLGMLSVSITRRSLSISSPGFSGTLNRDGSGSIFVRHVAGYNMGVGSLLFNGGQISIYGSLRWKVIEEEEESCQTSLTPITFGPLEVEKYWDTNSIFLWNHYAKVEASKSIFMGSAIEGRVAAGFRGNLYYYNIYLNESLEINGYKQWIGRSWCKCYEINGYMTGEIQRSNSLASKVLTAASIYAVAMRPVATISNYSANNMAKNNSGEILQFITQDTQRKAA